MTAVRHVVSLALVLVGALLGIALPTAAFAAPEVPPISYIYDSQVVSAPSSTSTIQRGPPGRHLADTFAAVDCPSRGASACSGTDAPQTRYIFIANLIRHGGAQ